MLVIQLERSEDQSSFAALPGLAGLPGLAIPVTRVSYKIEEEGG